MKIVFKIVGGTEIMVYEDAKGVTVAELLAVKELLEFENELPIEMSIEN